LDVRRARRRLRVGDRLRIVPNHVCPCVNLHDTLYGVEAEDVVVEWTVAGRGKVQ
jgi:D-serine deaminase-like pyridoxal phosphate-dependent protein